MNGISILPLLLRRKRTILLSGVAMACLAFGASKMLPLQYTAEANLQIDSKPAGSSDSSSSPVLTEVDTLQSKGHILRTVNTFNIGDVPDLVPVWRLPPVVSGTLASAWSEVMGLVRPSNGSSVSAVDKITTFVQSHLKVAAKEKSYVVSIQSTAGSPAAAATVANAIMDTYLTGVEQAKDARVAEIGAWINQELTARRNDVDVAERNVMHYVQSHYLSTVQGSMTSAIQLSKDQEQLSMARQELARKEAQLDTVLRGGSIQAADEVLGSRTIQSLKENEAKALSQIGVLSDIDPRRKPLQDYLTATRSKIASETELIRTSLSREVEVARSKVKALETSLKSQSVAAQDSTVAGAGMKQLTNDLEAKRQLYVSFVTEAQRARLQAEQAPTAHALFRALPPERPSHTYGIVSLLLGFVAGTAGSAATLVLRSMTNTKFKTPEEMATATGLPVFGSLPTLKQSRNLLGAPQELAGMTETFRALWVELRPQTIGTALVVTSSDTEEGKTTLAVSLAQRFADDGSRVLLIDADLRRPRLSKTLQPDKGNCLEAVLSGRMPFEHAIIRVKPNLDCLASSGESENPVKLLSSPQFKQLVEMAREQYDFVIMDSPPVLHVADPVMLAEYCQRILFIVQAERIPTELVTEATRRFSEEDRGKIIVLLTRVRPSLLDMRDYYSGYSRRAIT
jgi:succinoglycan biosynthesis transport protein ExoP